MRDLFFFLYVYILGVLENDYLSMCTFYYCMCDERGCQFAHKYDCVYWKSNIK